MKLVVPVCLGDKFVTVHFQKNLQMEACIFAQDKNSKNMAEFSGNCSTWDCDIHLFQLLKKHNISLSNVLFSLIELRKYNAYNI